MSAERQPKAPPAVVPGATGSRAPKVHLADGSTRPRRIAGMDLSRYQRPVLPGNRGTLARVAWYVVNALVFQNAIFSVVPNGWKASLLRAFGARVGRGFVCKPRVNIKYPWFLEIGDFVWLGEAVWIDNHCEIKIGDHVCISQAAYVFTGNHDWNDPGFRFTMAPVAIGSGAWIGAKATICPGTAVPAGEVVGAGAVVGRSTFAFGRTAVPMHAGCGR